MGTMSLQSGSVVKPSREVTSRLHQAPSLPTPEQPGAHRWAPGPRRPRFMLQRQQDFNQQRGWDTAETGPPGRPPPRAPAGQGVAWPWPG